MTSARCDRIEKYVFTCRHRHEAAAWVPRQAVVCAEPLSATQKERWLCAERPEVHAASAETRDAAAVRLHLQQRIVFLCDRET